MLKLKIAATAPDRLACFEVRKNCFIDRNHLFESAHSSYYFDEYDTLPNNFNIIARYNTVPVGSVRLSIGHFVPSEYFDFKSVLPKGKIAWGSMFCAKRKCGIRHVADWLIIYFFWLAYYKQIDYIVSCSNPNIEPLFRKYGFERAGDSFFHESFSEPILPIYLSRDKIIETLGKIKQFSASNKILKSELVIMEEEEITQLPSNFKIDKFLPVSLSRALPRNCDQPLTLSNKSIEDKFYVILS